MNDTPTRFSRDLDKAEMYGSVHERSGRVRGQGLHIKTQVSIQNATPADRDGLRRMFSRASSETIRLRFHIPYPVVPQRMLTLMLDVDHKGRGFLLAVAGEEIVGHAMYVSLDGAEAEMAIVVEDGWQSKGVGKALLSELAQRAMLQGIETFTAEVLSENRRMLGFAGVFAGTDYTIRDGVYHVRMPLPIPAPTTRAA